MLMTAALHMDFAHGHGHGASPSSPPPWLLADDDNNTHRRDHQLHICDLAASSAPSPAPATAAASPNYHQSLRPVAARRVSKRRPRPSRKLPTTYITADPASFRRMVHQVTGAHDLPAPPPPGTLCRPPPSRAAGAPSALTTLPTLDTSAFLLAGAAPRVEPPCAGSAGFAAAAQAEAGGVGAGRPCDYSSNSSCGGGFPTLDSWDPLF